MVKNRQLNMSSFKFGIICAILIFTSQVRATRLQAVNDDGDDYIDYELIAHTWGNIIRVAAIAAENIVGPVGEAVNDFSTNLDDIQKTTVKVATDALGVIKNLLVRQLTFAETHGANDDAKVLSACVKDEGDEIVTLIVSFWDEFTQCLNPSIIDMTSQLTPILDQLNTTFGGLEAIGSRIVSECDDVTCLTGAVLQIVELFEEFGEDVTPEWNGFVTNLVQFAKSFLKCNANEIPPWKKNVVQEINKVSTCIRK